MFRYKQAWSKAVARRSPAQRLGELGFHIANYPVVGLLAADAALAGVESLHFSRASKRIPYQMEQGIKSPKQGAQFPGSGKSLASTLQRRIEQIVDGAMLAEARYADTTHGPTPAS